ncbi:MAG: Glycerophosphoryl diester phosphodiesterase [uncultured bacterium]|nr:MAG: Glycerophosphoryl diester phosphodiesterase [uncultured bacterium]
MIKIGHRGACGYAPENTLSSVQKAIELGVDMIEFDVQICKSGEAIVFHDDSVNKKTNGKGLIKNLTIEQLRVLDVLPGEKIPTLVETLELINKKTKVNIELKGLGTAQIVADITREFIQNKNWKEEDFLVSSFHWQELEKFHDNYPEIKTGILAKRRLKGLFKYSQQNISEEALKIGAYSVNFPLNGITKAKVEKMHEKGLKVFVYTVNNHIDIKFMEEIGVDGIFSDFPDRIKS